MTPPNNPVNSHTASHTAPNHPNNLDDSSNFNGSNNSKHARLLSQQSTQCTQLAFLCSSLTPPQSLGNHKHLDRRISRTTLLNVTILQCTSAAPLASVITTIGTVAAAVMSVISPAASRGLPPWQIVL
jgi:hypothetical protein